SAGAAPLRWLAFQGMAKVLSIVLAGGEGKRLLPLTADRAKPAVPFGGIYRLVDFVLSNLANAGFLKIVVLTQYKSHSLDRHITKTWRMSTLLGNYVTPVPAQQRLGPRWFAGSADAIYQSLNLINDERPDHVIVFGADHIYRMDPRQMVDQHVAAGAGVTVAAIRQPRRLSDQFGVIEAGPDGVAISAFREKPKEVAGLPDSPDEVHADLLGPEPAFNLYNRHWPIYTGHDPLPPAKFAACDSGSPGTAVDSLVSPGVFVYGGQVERSVLSPGVMVSNGARVEDLVL